MGSLPKLVICFSVFACTLSHLVSSEGLEEVREEETELEMLLESLEHKYDREDEEGEANRVSHHQLIS